MKKLLPPLLFLLLITFSCTDESEPKSVTSENDVDAARNFIRAALDGDYGRAKKFMLLDSANIQLISAYEDFYQQRMTKEDKRGYREASIRVPDVRKVNDSVSVVTYSNSHKNKIDSLKVVRTGGQWLVDFKYSFASKDSSGK